MKRILFALMLVLTMGVVNAHAVPVEFLVSDLFDWGRLYAYDGTNWNPSNVNPYDGTAGNSIPAGNTSGFANGQEDSWGVAQIDQIQTLPSPGTLLFDKDILGSGEMTIFFWGFDDDYMTVPDVFTGDLTILSKGGHAEIWFDPTPDYTPGQGTAGRSNAGDSSFYNTVTDDGTLLLDLAPVIQTAGSHTFRSSFNFNDLTGSGTIYFGTTGVGAWDSVFDTNTQNFGSDFLFQYNTEPDPNGGQTGWVVRGSGRAVGDVVPEPASLTLLGLGLAGLARLRKKN